MTQLPDAPNFASAEWKRIFVDVLIRRMPEMNPDAADDVSDEQYLRCSHQSPERVALDHADAMNARAA